MSATGGEGSVQEKLGGVFTPLTLEHWKYVNYPLRGTREGFRIGFKEAGSVPSARKNMRSALENSVLVSAYFWQRRREEGFCWDR